MGRRYGCTRCIKHFYLVGRPIVFPWYTIDLTTQTASSLSSPPAGFRKLTSGYATMVHGRGCNPHHCTTTFANVESTSLWRHWWRHNSETIRDIQKRRPPRAMKSSELSNGENRIALWQLLQNRKLRHLWRHNLGSRRKLQKMSQENFSNDALYNITKNQHNPIKTVGRDSFLSPKTPKNTSFLGSLSPQGSHSPYILGDTTRPRRITYVQVWSKSDQRRLRKTLHKQTDKQTNRRQTDTTKIIVTWPWTNTTGSGLE